MRGLSGTCEAGVPVDCSDGVGCTDDSCNEATDDCLNDPNDLSCPDDGRFCTGIELCDAVNDCSSTGDPCADGAVCNEETDACDTEDGGGAASFRRRAAAAAECGTRDQQS